MLIHNVPNYAWSYRYIVYRTVDGAAYFWGAFYTLSEASRVAEEVHGYITEVENVENA